MTTTERTAERYWDAVEGLFDTFKDFEPHFVGSENARHHLRLAMGTEHEDAVQSHSDSTDANRVRGCFQLHLHRAGLERYLAGGNVIGTTASSPNDYVVQGYLASKWAVRYFGTSISLARETDLRRRLVAGIDTLFVENDPRFAVWLADYDDVTVTPVNGNVRVVVHARVVAEDESVSYVPELPRRVFSSSPYVFNGTDILFITGYQPSDTNRERDAFKVTVPAGFKASVKIIGTTEETLTTSATGDYTLTYGEWLTHRDKVGNTAMNPFMIRFDFERQADE